MSTQVGIAVMLLLVGGIAGGCVGWVMRRDDAQSRVEANRRYYEARLAELAAQLQGVTVPVSAPATTVVQHFHLPAGYPAPAPAAPRYLEVLPAAALERGRAS